MRSTAYKWRRRWLAAAAVGLAGGAPAVFVAEAGAVHPPPPSGMSLIFTDFFPGSAGTGPTRSNWLSDIGTNYPGGAANWGTGEVDRMTDSPQTVYQDGAGNLVIKPIRDAAGNWTSG